MALGMALRIAQINLNRCRLAQDLMEHTMSELAVDVVIISEPYRQQKYWFNDASGDAAIWVTGFNGHFPTMWRPVVANGVAAVSWEGKVLISCYCSPKTKLPEFGSFLDTIEGILVEKRAAGIGAVLAGDWNARSPAWGGCRLDRKGTAILDLLGRHGLVPVRVPDRFKHTFERNGRKSFIDIMSVDRVTARGLKSEVLSQPSYSDHSYVLHSIRRTRGPARAVVCRRYSTKGMDPDVVARVFGHLNDHGSHDQGVLVPADEPRAAKLQRTLEEVTRSTLPLKSVPRGSRKPNGWWNEDIAEARRESFRKRRAYQKKRKRKAADVEVARLAYLGACKEVQYKIWRAKEAQWRDLHALVDVDPWGKPYKCVMSRLKGPPQRLVMSPAQVREAIGTLFVTPPALPISPPYPLFGTGGVPSRGVVEPDIEETIGDVDDAMVWDAVGRIKPNKAPGMDAVPSEVVACIAKAFPSEIKEMVHDTLRRGTIPPSWKRARLVLIPKPGKDPMTPGAFRPISVLPALSKVWEHIMKAVIECQIGSDPFHPSQFGFRRGRGTVNAILEVTSFAEGCVAKTKKRICAMVTLDVKNAFNTLGWDLILAELDRRGVSRAVLRVMKDYLSDRWVTAYTPMARVDREILAGVPQGSVLGPFLWNIVYDGVLTDLNTGRFMKAVAYADDLALLFSARDVPQLEAMMGAAMGKVRHWFGTAGLEIATQKTEVVLLAGLRSAKIMDFDVLGAKCVSGRSLRYLGVTLDCRRRFKLHLVDATMRADKLVGALASLLPNTRGPSRHARRLYYAVWESVVLYAAPAWAGALNVKVNRAILRRSQRSALIRTTTAYRTVAHQAVCVLAGRMPLDVRAVMMRAVFLASAGDPASRGPPVDAEARARITALKRSALEDAMIEWQTLWDGFDRENWTRRLVASVRTFCGASVLLQMDYWTMQLLTSHGSFASFRVRLGKASCAACGDCGAARDDAEHVLVVCPSYNSERAELEGALGAPVAVATVIGLAAGSAEKWTAFRAFAEKVMGDRAHKEVELEKRTREEQGRRAREEAAARALLNRRRARKRKNGPPAAGGNPRPAKARRTTPPGGSLVPWLTASGR